MNKQLYSDLPISRETGRRWRRRRRVPPLAQLAIDLKAGQLGRIHGDWSGWILNNRTGELVSPEGVCWSVGRLTAWGYEWQLLDEYRRKLASPEQWRLI